MHTRCAASYVSYAPRPSMLAQDHADALRKSVLATHPASEGRDARRSLYRNASKSIGRGSASASEHPMPYSQGEARPLAICTGNASGIGRTRHSPVVSMEMLVKP